MSTSNTTATQRSRNQNQHHYYQQPSTHHLCHTSPRIMFPIKHGNLAIQAIVAFGSSEYMGYHLVRTHSFIELLDDFFLFKKNQYSTPVSSSRCRQTSWYPGAKDYGYAMPDVDLDYIFSFTVVPENGPSYKYWHDESQLPAYSSHSLLALAFVFHENPILLRLDSHFLLVRPLHYQMAKLEDFAVVNTGHWWGVSTCEWPAVRCSNADSQNVEAAAFINARPTIANMNNIPSKCRPKLV
jgi:hypothetical protein